MLTKITSQYEKGKTKEIKLLLLCIKAITGVLGASMLLTDKHPYITLVILCIGALMNEILNFIYEKGRSRILKFIALCIKSITGITGASMILTEQKPYFTLIVLCIGAIANEILNFITTEESIVDNINTPQP